MPLRRSAMRSRMVFAVMLCAATFLAANALPAPGAPGSPRITVMTWNIYSGGDFEHILEGSLANAMGDMFESVQATDFQSRAAAIARDIDQHRPHVIALQEVSFWRATPLFGGGSTTYDFLPLLQNALAARGLNYDLVGALTTIDFEAPGFVHGNARNIHWIERIVTLVRHSNQLHVSNVRLRRYDDTFSIDTGVAGDIEFRRGWIAADVNFQGSRFRFVNTHLESLSNSVQVNQADQLIDWLSGTPLPVVIAGDMNVVAGSGIPPTYNHFLAAGYADAWAARNPIFSGPTCCQDGDLQNAASHLDARIDLVMTRGALSSVSAARVGQRQTDRTPSGLWPSDHAGVVARLELQ